MSRLTYAEAIRIAAEKLHDAGIEGPLREARRLVLWASEMAPAELISAEPTDMAFSHQAAWRMAVRHRVARRPFAHLAGSTEFYGLSLRCDHRALIPRADSECVVDLALEHLPAKASGMIADLGTGTGALLLAILSKRPSITGMGVEQDTEAVSLAAQNIHELGLEGRAALFESSWDEWTGWSDCDLIISNPPYIESADIQTLEPEVRDHDPVGALDGGPDGLDAYREIITLAAAQMKSSAHLVFEIGYDQKDAVTRLLEEVGFIGIQHAKDLSGHDRAITARKA